MSQSSLGTLLRRLEDWRLHQHFKRVETVLRARDVSHLSLDAQQARKRYLDNLHAYAERGIFPRNYERFVYAPCFIDREGRECAVAHLVMTSGNSELAHNIATVANYAYVPQMTFPELDDWAAKAGLTKEEVALIQPGYYFTLTGETLSLVVAIWGAGLVSFLLNVVQMFRRRDGVIVPTIGFVVAAVLLLLASFCLFNAAETHAIGINRDVGSEMRADALSHEGGWQFGAMTSIGIAFLTGGISLYRKRKVIFSLNGTQKRSADASSQTGFMNR